MYNVYCVYCIRNSYEMNFNFGLEADKRRLKLVPYLIIFNTFSYVGSKLVKNELGRFSYKCFMPSILMLAIL